MIDPVNCAFTVPGSVMCSFFEAEVVRVILFNEPGVGKAEVAVLAYYDVVKDLDLDCGVAIT